MELNVICLIYFNKCIALACSVRIVEQYIGQMFAV